MTPLNLPTLTTFFEATHPDLIAARLNMLGIAYRGIGAAVLAVGLLYLLTDLLSTDPMTTSQWARSAVIIGTSIGIIVIPVRNLWATLPIASTAGIASLLAAIDLDMMYGYVGILFSALIITLWVGTWRGMAVLTFFFGALAGLTWGGYVQATPEAWLRMPIYWLLGGSLVVSIGLIVRTFDQTLYANDETLKRYNTQRHEAERSLERALLAEEELTTAIGQLRVADAELVAKSAKQKEIFAAIGHELRTPAASLRMLVDEDMTDANNQEMLRSQSRQLINVLDDMRQVVDPNFITPIQAEPVLFQALARDVEQSCAPTLSYSNTELTWRFHFTDTELAHRPVLIDAGRVGKILVNLVRNACLHAAGDRVIVSMNQSPTRLSIQCEDDGRGWPAEARRDQLLEPWTREDHSRSGMGLGLSICKRTVDELGGTLTLYDAATGGAGIDIGMPLQLQPAGTKNWRESMAIPVMARQRLLVVDDDATLRMLSQRQLSPLFASVEVAVDGNDGLAKISQNPPDIILTDHFMPGMAGDEMVNRARNNGFKGLIVGATGATLFEGVHPMLAAGANFLMPKPVMPANLVELLEPLLDERNKRFKFQPGVGAGHSFGLGLETPDHPRRAG